MTPKMKAWLGQEKDYQNETIELTACSISIGDFQFSGIRVSGAGSSRRLPRRDNAGLAWARKEFKAARVNHRPGTNVIKLFSCVTYAVDNSANVSPTSLISLLKI